MAVVASASWNSGWQTCNRSVQILSALKFFTRLFPNTLRWHLIIVDTQLNPSAGIFAESADFKKLSLNVHHFLNKHFLTIYDMFAFLKTVYFNCPWNTCYSQDGETGVTYASSYTHLSQWKKLVLLPIPVSFLASFCQIHWLKYIDWSMRKGIEVLPGTCEFGGCLPAALFSCWRWVVSETLTEAYVAQLLQTKIRVDCKGTLSAVWEKLCCYEGHLFVSK